MAFPIPDHAFVEQTVSRVSSATLSVVGLALSGCAELFYENTPAYSVDISPDARVADLKQKVINSFKLNGLKLVRYNSFRVMPS